MRKTKEQKAITLIALVITIIVMLILAGVSIATLTGDNGVLTQAGNAKEVTGKKEVIERAQVDILGVESNNEGKINKTQFIEVLGKFFNNETLPSAEELPDDMSTATQKITAKKEYGGYEIKISEIWNGKFTAGTVTTFNPETFELGAPVEDTIAKYGWKVTGYTKTTPEFTTGVWRLFYQDSNYTYLITDELTNVEYKPSDYYTTVTKEDGTLKYQTGADVSVVGQKLSKMLLDKGTFFIESNTNINIRSTAWLTDTEAEIWKQYKNEDAVFAIGRPTVELYKASFDATASANNATTFTLEAGTNGYTEGTSFRQLKTIYNYGIYHKGMEEFCWIASPYDSRDGGDMGMILFAWDDCFDCYEVNILSENIRPIVCIPTDVFDEKYASTLVDGY